MNNNTDMHQRAEDFSRHTRAGAQRPAQHNLERDRATWAEKKIGAGVMAQRLFAIGKFSRCYRMKECADTVISDVCGKCEARYVIRTNFCRDRLCPVCSWRRSRRLTQRLGEIIAANEAEKHSRYLLLTLTIRNVLWNELLVQVKAVMESWRKMIKRIKRASAVTGWVRTFEVTRSQERGDAHPHFHILLQVPPEYFSCPCEAGDRSSGLHYHKKDELIQQWKECLKAEYSPSISINAVRDTIYEIGRTVAEVAKYTAKSAAIGGLSDIDFRYYVEGVHGVHSWSTGGRMRINDDEEIEPFLHDDSSMGSAEGICKHCGGRLFEMREVWSSAEKAYIVKGELDYNNLITKARDEAQTGCVVNLSINSGGGDVHVGDVYNINGGRSGRTE